jgi:hypothetical protein
VDQSKLRQQQEFLTEADLERLGFASRRTFQGWRLLQKGPKFYRLSNGMIRYRWHDIEAYLAARAVNPGAAK